MSLPGTFTIGQTLPPPTIDFLGIFANGGDGVTGTVNGVTEPEYNRLLVAVTVDQRGPSTLVLGGVGFTQRRYIDNGFNDLCLWSVRDSTLAGSQSFTYTSASTGSHTSWVAFYAINYLRGTNDSPIANGGGAESTSADVNVERNDVVICYGGTNSGTWGSASGYTQDYASTLLVGTYKPTGTEIPHPITQNITPVFKYTFGSSVFR